MPACWRSISRSIVASVIDLKVAFAFSSISDNTAPSAASTGAARVGAACGGTASSNSSNIWMMSISVRRLALPVKR